MSKNPGATFAKRARERARQEKQQAKAAERAQRRAEKKARGPLEPGEDPDIAGIVPGPQPRRDDES
ncbi:MAG TPA: hypothetical protein P5234_15605 [Thermoanaerobaculaceae bacterium]|nr:hypothetical protein [Thermoanaerobaculaceae bacterium]HRS17661.1 hypothetical protein [Thermoanaerobaculaceae bacterium]